jgi:hypothetical protein
MASPSWKKRLQLNVCVYIYIYIYITILYQRGTKGGVVGQNKNILITHYGLAMVSERPWKWVLQHS